MKKNNFCINSLSIFSILIFSLIFTLIFVTNLVSETFQIDTNKSSIFWTGNKVTGSHNGIVKLKSGSVSIDNLDIKSGSFEIDLTTITNKDIESKEYKKKLEDHLKSDDFFNISEFPTGTFEIKSSTKKDTETIINGILTIKGISLPISFPSIITKTDNVYRANAKLKMDRTKWDIRYNSGSFFDPANLGDKLIYDDIEIEIELFTK